MVRREKLKEVGFASDSLPAASLIQNSANRLDRLVLGEIRPTDHPDRLCLGTDLAASVLPIRCHYAAILHGVVLAPP